MKRRKPKEVWSQMGWKAKIGSIAAIVASLIVLYNGAGVARSVVDTYRPWATIDTEILVAGWQSDRVRAELRDVKERIDRLENKRSRLGPKFDPDDQKTLNGLYRDRDNLNRIIKELDQSKRPVVEK